jgi:hypothetical protein
VTNIVLRISVVYNVTVNKLIFNYSCVCEIFVISAVRPHVCLQPYSRYPTMDVTASYIGTVW